MTTSTQTQHRRGTNAQVLAMTPAAGEMVIDTTNTRPYYGDGSTLGGIPVPTAHDSRKQTFLTPTIGGSGDAITGTNVPVISSLVTNLKQRFKATASNTGAVTYAPDGLTAKNVKKMLDGALTALSAGDIVSGGIYDIEYDGTQWQIFGIGQTSPSPGSLVYLGTFDASASATLDLTSVMSSTYDDYIIELDHFRPASNGVDLWLRTSTDNTTFDSAGANYYYGFNTIAPTASSTATSSTTGSSSANKIVIASTVSNNASLCLSGRIILRGTNSALPQKLSFETDYFDSGGASGTSFRASKGSGVRAAAASVNAIRLMFESGNITSGSAKIYGIAKA